MADIELLLYLSTDRDQSGLLVARDGASGRELLRLHALGRGSKGPGNTQLRQNGSTPTGVYKVVRLKDTSSWNAKSYGPNGALQLQPISGRALEAEQLVGRKGLLIHGGSLGAPTEDGTPYWRGNGELRATHGCVRVSDDGMRQLVDLLHGAMTDPIRGQSSELDVTLTVTDLHASINAPALR